MNRGVQESPALITLNMLIGLVVFMLAVVVIFIVIASMIQTGQSILGHISYTSMNWPYR